MAAADLSAVDIAAMAAGVMRVLSVDFAETRLMLQRFYSLSTTRRSLSPTPDYSSSLDSHSEQDESACSLLTPSCTTADSRGVSGTHATTTLATLVLHLCSSHHSPFNGRSILTCRLLSGVLALLGVLLLLTLSSRSQLVEEREDDGAQSAWLSAWEVVRVAAPWRGALRQAMSSQPWQEVDDTAQSHTAVCIHFNFPPLAVALATVLQVQLRLHRHLTLISPTPLPHLPLRLPRTVRYIECATQASIVRGDPSSGQGLGMGGELQHLCAAACFEHYDSEQVPGMRGVLFHSDDMYVDYTRLFSDEKRFPPSSAWAPGDGTTLLDLSTVSLLQLSTQGDWLWYNRPVGNLFAFRQSLQLLQSNERVRRAWLVAYPSLSMAGGHDFSDLFYLPTSYLRNFVTLVTLLSSAEPQYVTVPDMSRDALHAASLPNSSVELRTGMSMCELITPTLVALSAAMSRAAGETTTRGSGGGGGGVVWLAQSVRYVRELQRGNMTLLESLVLGQQGQAVTEMMEVAVHPLKHSVEPQRLLYIQAYSTYAAGRSAEMETGVIEQ